MSKSSARARARSGAQVKVKPAGIVLVLALIAVAAYFALNRPAPKAFEVALTEGFDALDRWQFKPGAGQDYKFSLESGELVAEVTGTALHNWMNELTLDEGSIEVSARWLSGQDLANGRYGLILGRTANNSAVHFEYYPHKSGAWSLIQASDGRFNELARGTAPSNAVRPATGRNVLKATSQAGQLTLALNGVTLQTVNVGNAVRGPVGVSVSSDTGKLTRVAFDNFVVAR
jgi:hypothetical protein